MLVNNNNSRFRSTRSGKPGGRKADAHTKAQLWVRVDELSLSEGEKKTIKRKLANRINSRGELEIESRDSRSFEVNRTHALERANELIEKALEPVLERVPTRPPKSAGDIRIMEKRMKSQKKNKRRIKLSEEE